MTKMDTKTASKCDDILEILKECIGVRKVNVQIDDRINCPEWINKRVKERIYNLCFPKKFLISIKPTDILNYCNLAIKSICPMCAENVICRLHKKGKTLDLYFTLS